MEEICERLKIALAELYEVERPLGEGGMAFVFLARDIKHDRKVAVKVLKPELAASLGHERFLREIQVTAKLQHPHILPLYDSGEADHLVYYVMPFVEGESLHSYLSHEKQLSLDEAVQITREVAEALAYAHSYGLVHRDIKPDNVMMSRGHAIVADFGISLAVSQAGGEKLTQTGMSVGTPAYMSPEQAAGDPSVDGRTDIYALGCMLYEMLVGDIPFTGPTPQAIIARHTMDQITPPSIMRQSIPEALEDVVIHAMEKVPADRYRTAHEMVEDLIALEKGQAPGAAPRASVGVRRSQIGMRASRAYMAEPPKRRWPLLAGIGGAALVVLSVGGWLLLGRGNAGPVASEGGLDPRDIAVLYFEDLSQDGGLGYVADGITDGLVSRLARVQGLQVVSRNGVAPYRGSDLPRDSIARALKTGTIVVGSVEPAGGDLRVSVRLVDGNSGVDLERSSIQVPASDLLAARDSVIETVAGFLRARIGQEVRVRELRAETRSVEAWSLLQRGVRVRGEAAEAGGREAQVARLAEADSLLRLAAAADPQWPEPSIQRGWVAFRRAELNTGRAAAPSYEEAIELAQAALASDPNDARALELRGTARFRYYEAKITEDPTVWERLLTDAREDLEAATGVDPELASAHLTLSVLYYWFDDVGSALISAQRAYSADAYLERANDVIDRVFWGLIDQEQFGQAETWCGRGSARFPDDFRFVTCHLFLMVTPAITPDVDSAWRLSARLADLNAPAFARAQAGVLVGGILARAQLADSARGVWQRNREGITAEVDPGQQLAALEAYARTLAGDLDQAIDLLKLAVAANPDHDFAETAGRTWWWRELRAYPRWREIAGGR